MVFYADMQYILCLVEHTGELYRYVGHIEFAQQPKKELPQKWQTIHVMCTSGKNFQEGAKVDGLGGEGHH